MLHYCIFNTVCSVASTTPTSTTATVTTIATITTATVSIGSDVTVDKRQQGYNNMLIGTVLHHFLPSLFLGILFSLFACLFVCLFVYLFALFVCLFVCLHICFTFKICINSKQGKGRPAKIGKAIFHEKCGGRCGDVEGGGEVPTTKKKRLASSSTAK